MWQHTKYKIQTSVAVVLLGYSHTHSFMNCLCSAAVAEWSSCNKDLMAHKPKIFIVANPLLQMTTSFSKRGFAAGRPLGYQEDHLNSFRDLVESKLVLQFMRVGQFLVPLYSQDIVSQGFQLNIWCFYPGSPSLMGPVLQPQLPSEIVALQIPPQYISPSNICLYRYINKINLKA